MAVKREELKQRQDTVYAAKVKEYEASIDRQLERDYYPGAQVYVGVEGMNAQVMLRIKELYKAAGWSIRESTDQRGESITGLVFS